MIIKKYFQTIFCFASFLVFLSSCEKDLNIDTAPPTTVNSNKSSVLIYMVADNDLDRDALNNIEKIKEGIQNTETEGDVFIYYDGESSSLENPPLLLKVYKKDSEQKVDTVQTYSEANSASKERLDLVLSDYLNHAKSAKRKGLILWSHGTGWLPACFPNCEVQTRSFGEDLREDKYGRTPAVYSMEIKDLANAIPQNTFEYIIFDACLMQCVEVVYQLRDKTDYILGGTSLLPATGHPYPSLVPLLLKKDIDYEEVAKNVFNEYDKNERENGGASYSLVKTGELRNLASVMNKIMKNYKLEDIHGRWSTRKIQGFDHAFGDPIFYDFVHYMHSFVDKQELATLQDQLNKTILFKNSTKTVLSGARSTRLNRIITVDFYSGLSINRFGVVDNRKMGIEEAYKKLDWYKDVYQ